MTGNNAAEASGSRKGIGGLSCAECRRSAIRHLFGGVLRKLTHFDPSIRSKLKCDRYAMNDVVKSFINFLTLQGVSVPVMYQVYSPGLSEMATLSLPSAS